MGNTTIIIIGDGNHYTDAIAYGMRELKGTFTAVSVFEMPHIDFDNLKFSEPIILQPREFSEYIAGAKTFTDPRKETEAFNEAITALRKLASEIEPEEYRREVLLIPSLMPATHEGRHWMPKPDRIPVPKSYKRNRHKL